MHMASAVRDAPEIAEFIRTRRWFRSKTRAISKAEIEDIIQLAGQSARILIVRLEYAEGGYDYYVLTDRGENIGQPVEALEDAGFRASLLQAFQQNARYPGESGELLFSRTEVFPDNVAFEKLESSVSRAEQSNTSVIYGDRFILKLFRKIEAGINPDVEVGTFLTEHGCTHTPAVFGTLEYRSRKNDAYSAGILQQFVANEGDAWGYTLNALREYFNGAAIDDYLTSAALLGQRTAEMHAALAQGGKPDFDPEPFTPEAGQKLYQEMLAQADIAFETLRRKRATLSGEAAELAQKLVHLEHRVTERFAALRDRQITASRIRFHGDYHLGQVLWTGSDFMIIDFEGEPARPLQERRTKTLAMRDVAGMLRSFQYAAYAALFERGSNSPEFEESADKWNESVSDEYLRAYMSAAEGSAFLPADPEQRRILLDAFTLHKALYEVVYEMNNRPDWVRIPLRGILSLVD